VQKENAMKKGIIILTVLITTITANAAVRYPSPMEMNYTTRMEIDHVKWWKINRGLAMGTGVAGLGLLTYNVVNSTIRFAEYDDQANYWNMKYESGFISENEFAAQRSVIEKNRAELRTTTRRNYIISGALFVASAGFILNAHRHSMKANRETTVMVGPGGVYVAYRF
jgi:hypothetical protein